MRKNVRQVLGAGIQTHILLNTSLLAWPLDQCSRKISLGLCFTSVANVFSRSLSFGIQISSEYAARLGMLQHLMDSFAIFQIICIAHCIFSPVWPGG